jgi:MYXO-CTERM domain-containing protein
MRHLASFTLALGVLAAIPTAAHAFCGFYVGGAGAKMFNNATEVVLMRHGTTTVLSMENNYQGPPEGFALVVPVPVVVKEAQVKTLPREVFAKVDVLGAPRLVEYWEQDPCNPYVGVAFSGSTQLESVYAVDDRSDSDEEEYHVKIEAQFSVGEYDIVVLSASESTGLDRWLRANKYEIPKGAEPLLRPYVESGSKFFVAKVDPKKVQFVDGMATLSPLRVQYDAAEFTLPIRLGLANSSGTQDLIVNVLAPNNTRYEVANYPNVTIPTNLAVTEEVKARFGEFYAALFDHTLSKAPGAVVTEYAWDSGNCDPCPGPVLDGNDLATLGADVLQASYSDVSYAFTLTRLHARYGTDVGDDLVFKAVAPLQGGRGTPDAGGNMPVDTAPSSYNNFQGRYAILHPWTAPVTCESPQRGIWGGPNGQAIAAQAAQNLAFAPRGQVALTSLVAQDVPSIGLLSSGDQRLPLPVRKPQGCTCAAGGGGMAASTVALLVGAFGLLVFRRRRR